MGHGPDLSQWFGAHYYRTYRGAPYERSPLWLNVMGLIAEGILREFHQPRTVLDAGCALGLLVEALRDRGVEAYGLDISEYAISQVHERVKPYCWVGSIQDPLAERYDLIVCHEVLEHLPAADAELAVARLCAAADDVLFSSTPDGYDEDTHLNVQPVDYWAGLFARHGFVRDLDLNTAGFLQPWACRFRRATEPMHRTMQSYERKLWTLSRENAALRARVLDQTREIAVQAQQMRERPEVAPLERTIEEQREHLDALTERIAFMNDREADMRRMLLDTHEQLLARDQLLQARVPAGAVQDQQALVEERTAWAQRAVAEVEASRVVVRDLQETVEARTAWAQRTVEELETSRAVVRELQATVEARTAWAKDSLAELERAHALIAELRASLDARTAWAQSAVAETEAARARVTSLEATAADHARRADEHAALAEQQTRALQQILNSRTWRASAPLRRLVNGSR